MSAHNLNSYIIHLPILQVVVCRFCEIGIPPKDPLNHYARHHTTSKEHPIPMEIRHKVAAYMETIDLCDPKEIVPPGMRIPQIKIIEEGWVCKFTDCCKCATSEGSMRTHYYAHQDHIPNDFKNWEETSLQTVFDGQNKK
jgi:Orsellinic acid/F9775 biosynthesis cluster protein D